jgi:hypothetical protein
MKQLDQVRGIPYRCSVCGGIQIVTGAGAMVNCNRSNCHSDHIRRCGPRQSITIVVYQGAEIKLIRKPKKRLRHKAVCQIGRYE